MMPNGHRPVETNLAEAFWIGGPGHAFCRYEFDLPCRAVQARMVVVADPHSYAIEHWQMPVGPFQHEHWLLGGSFVKYRVYVNDGLAAVGPFRAVLDGMSVLQEYDVAPFLQPGRNALAVLSRGEKRGFALVLEVWDAEGVRHVIKTSPAWKQRDANGLYRSVCWECQAIDNAEKGGPGPGEYPEHLDGTHEPQGWRRPGFDDRAWTTAQTYGLAGEHFESAGAPPYQISRLTPIAIRKLGEGNYLADFGREILAGMELTAPQGGGKVELRLAEELLPNSHARYLLRTENCYQELWTFVEGSDPLSHFGLRMFRYAEVDGWTGECDENSLTAIAVNAPFDRHQSWLECSDAGLSQVWTFCKNSVAAATADLYTDCMSRERTAYEADSYVAMLTQFATEGSSAMARRTLAYLVNHPNWPCEWRQFFIPLFYEYLLHTGDYDFVAEHYDFLCRKGSFHRLMQDGLILEFPQEIIVDWPQSSRDGYVFGRGNAVANAFAHWDLTLLGELAGYLGRDRDESRFAELASELKDSFNRCLFDPSTGLYVDSLNAVHSSLHANMYALRFGLVPPDRRKLCVDFVKSRGMACSVFGAQFLLETLFLNGEDHAAVALMTSDRERSWLEMIRGGATVTTESWLTDPKNNMSWAHPWGSGPGNVIVRYLFGLRPTAPGWTEYAFDPKPGGLAFGSLNVPTPRGHMKASFARQDEKYRFSLETPECGQAPEVAEPVLAELSA